MLGVLKWLIVKPLVSIFLSFDGLVWPSVCQRIVAKIKTRHHFNEIYFHTNKHLNFDDKLISVCTRRRKRFSYQKELPSTAYWQALSRHGNEQNATADNNFVLIFGAKKEKYSPHQPVIVNTYSLLCTRIDSRRSKAAPKGIQRQPADQK